MSASLAAFERPRLGGASNTVFKSGPLFISLKGLGWKSWKKRWFILTCTSLVFFKNDPSALPPKGGEVNLTLGGIDLNNSGSVVVREYKKLLTVLFPDGRDGRAFTLKAETLEDLYEWKTALEQALAQAPSAALLMGDNGIFQNDTSDAIDGSFHLCPFSAGREKRPVKSSVVGRPILLALEDIDGGPSFLEKALRFLETYGVKVEGILRQSADVEEVERRVRDYEQGKNEFDMDEDAHVVGDCVKHVLRELPSSPVPASCCTALLEAYKIESKEARVRAMRLAIPDAFPEPNQRLLQRVLKMMHIIASHSSDNRMSSSAVAACMAPLLLRPLLAGECEFDDDFDMTCDNSTQLLAAANAASNAQAIIATLLEEYENIFDRCSISADSHIENSENDDPTDDESVDVKDKGYHDGGNEADHERDNDQTDDDQEWILGGKMSESSGYAGSKLFGYKAFGADESDGSPHANHASSVNSKAFSTPQTFQKYDPQLSDGSKPVKLSGSLIDVMESPMPPGEFYKSMGEILSSMDPLPPMPIVGLASTDEKPIRKFTGSNKKRTVLWGRSIPQKSPSLEPIDSSGEEELAIQRLETIKNDLRRRIANEARGNATLQASLERRKQAVHEHRLALEQDVQRLQKQLQAERDLRAALEVGSSMSPGQLSGSHGMDPKMRAELEEIALAEADVARLKQKVAELHRQLNLQRQHHFGLLSDASVRRFLRQDFDSTLAFCTYERKQGNEERLLGPEVSPIRGQMLDARSSTRQPHKQFVQSTSSTGSKSAESSCHSVSMPSPARLATASDFPRHMSMATSTLLELTTRLDSFKERRSQLMEQLRNLDLNYGLATSQDYLHRPLPPSWS